MKSQFLLLTSLLLLVFSSCNSNIGREDISKLNGYWEIKQVELPNGEKKDYKVNETIDFFELRHLESSKQLDDKPVGFRQKVMPQFDGKYSTNGIKESFSIIEKEECFFLEYKTKYGNRKEQIIEIKDSILILKNKDNLAYIYKRFKPFSLK